MREKINREDFIGKRYGRLVIESFSGTRKKVHFYMVKCDCGNTKEVRLTSLQGGGTVSCGCRRKEVTQERNHQLIFRNP